MAVVAALNGPNTVSVCDIATYSSSGSTGAGGRALTYRYRVTSEYDTTAILTVIQAMPAGSCSWVVPFAFVSIVWVLPLTVYDHIWVIHIWVIHIWVNQLTTFG